MMSTRSFFIFLAGVVDLTEGHHIFRRLFHSFAWIFLVYYLVPQTIFGYSRAFLFLIVVLIILGFEGIRLYKGWHIFGLRSYERHQIAAYAWATMAAAISLLLFPMHLAVVCLIGMGFIDPLIGELKDFWPKLYPYIPLIGWFVISMCFMRSFTDHTLLQLTLLSAIGSTVAIAAEYPRLMIDDDFLMVVVPLIVLRAVEILFF